MACNHHYAQMPARPVCSNQDTIVQWLTSQQQILSIWLEHIDNLTSADEALIAVLMEHHRWLSGILPFLDEELTAKGPRVRYHMAVE